MTSLVWRSLLTLSLPLALGACPGDDDMVADDGSGPASTGAGSTTSAGASTGPHGASSSGAADSSSGGTTAAAETTTDAASSSTGASGDSSGSGEAGDSGEAEITVCGNNIIEGNEACDLAQLKGETCQSLGYQGGQLGCLLTCSGFNVLGCFSCGDGTVDLAEDCEGSVPENVTCEALGYDEGTVTCGDDCLYDLSGCAICGDGIREGSEECDGIDYGGSTCQILGFDEGELGCNIPTCRFDMSGCSGGQYLQNFEAGVMPPEFTLGGNIGFVVDTNTPIAGAFSAHSGPIGNSQTSSMTLNAGFPAGGTVSFSLRVSTESCCDHLRFFVDGVQVGTWSGTAGTVQQFSTNVTAGAHTLEWRYIKDISINSGQDMVWVDDIALVPGVPL